VPIDWAVDVMPVFDDLQGLEVEGDAQAKASQNHHFKLQNELE